MKVTGGGRSTGAVAAHFSYISGKGRIDLETDEGQRIDKEGQKEFSRAGISSSRPDSTAKEAMTSCSPPAKAGAQHRAFDAQAHPPDKVLAAARAFAREHFGAKHQYAMALHTHHDHPHVHLVVKAEGRDGLRLHIDKAMLRECASTSQN